VVNFSISQNDGPDERGGHIILNCIEPGNEIEETVNIIQDPPEDSGE
jgi:hypothetical protein